ncbi:MAG: hypothetical protein A2014_01030 [Spirochaetes bacterium GWF1_49_6]|nr:MAG: hypothetical protein A2014_01030 [Spirochaetes bacterium GWF1_49_6]
MIFRNMSYPGEIQDPFTFISIDCKTEEKLGINFPFDRSVYAEMINHLKNYQPKAIVLKFFFDLPKSKKGDQQLADSFKGIPVFLQATINQENSPNAFLPRFNIFKNNSKNILTPFCVAKEKNGWIPLPIFQTNCYDIGFVDVYPTALSKVPLLTKYGDEYYKSLWFSIFTFIYPDAELVPGEYLNIKGKKISVTKYNEISIILPGLSITNNRIISAIDIMEDKTDKKLIKDKIVILIFSGKMFNEQYKSKGQMTPHEIFLLMLTGLYNKIGE